jgi:Uma2 family endonuclease
MVVSARTFEQLVLEDGDAQWELDRGLLRQKPGMSMAHNRTMFELGFLVRSQVDPARYGVRVDSGHLLLGDDLYYVPDVCVVPAEMEAQFEGIANRIEAYAAPLPFVAEVWSPSTGSYDVNTKVKRYQERGDAEIWLVNPFERTVRAWIRRLDGGYDETSYSSGLVPLAVVPGVTIDLDALFRAGR